MKTLRILGLFFIAGLLFSCEKDVKEEKMGEVSFGIEHVDPFDLKSDGAYDIECPDDLTPLKARIVITEDLAGTIPVGVGTYEPLVFFLNERWYTQSIKLPADKEFGTTYYIQEFYLIGLDENDDEIIVMATPAAGSDYAPYVEYNTVVTSFTVEPFKKEEIKMWVLCYEEAAYDAFGFFWFRLNRIVVREKCFFGDICLGNPDDYEGSWYENQNEDGDLYFDMPALFKIHAYKGSVDDDNELPNSPFTNANDEANWGVGAPVCVLWPDNIDIEGEVFIFELWIYIAVDDDFDFVLFHTWTFEDDEMVGYNGDQVIDFVLGGCFYDGTPPFLPLDW